MIFYFSATGNSLYVAKNIAQKQGLKIFDMAELLNTKRLIFVPKDGEVVGFVFPIYAWAPPKLVLDFIDKLQLARKNNFIFAVCTCGSEAGLGMEVFRQTLINNNIPLNADFSIFMPDSFILHFDVCDKFQQQTLFEKADVSLSKINELITRKRSSLDTFKGRLPLIKTKIINPIFRRFGVVPRKFYTTTKCHCCELCAKICPTKNITFPQGELPKPHWGINCTGCLACLHRCPNQAIQYGVRTIHKERYYNPNCDKINV